MRKTKTKTKTPEIPILNRNITAPLKDGDTPDTFGTRMAGLLLDPTLMTSRVISSLEGKTDFGNYIHYEGFKNQLKADAQRIKGGDLGNVEEMLFNQAVSLQSIYARMIERAACQENIPAIDLFMRVALRAQNQSRMTLETLSAVKNPPLVIAKQANISQGHQQVNNGLISHVQTEKAQNKLLEQTNGERLDTRKTETAGGNYPALETLGAINGTEE